MPAFVITPNDQVHSYPAAHYAVRGERCTELYDSSEKKAWIADVPKEWAVGWHRPRPVGIDQVAEELRRDIRSAPGSVLASIKLALRKFDARTHYWKG
jgi:hypothetical protein